MRHPQTWERDVKHVVDSACKKLDGESVEDDRPIERISLVEVFDKPVPETPWVVPGWLAERDRIVIGGQRKAGKSTLFTDLALCLATGTNWLGQVIGDGGRPDAGPNL